MAVAGFPVLLWMTGIGVAVAIWLADSYAWGITPADLWRALPQRPTDAHTYGLVRGIPRKNTTEWMALREEWFGRYVCMRGVLHDIGDKDRFERWIGEPGDPLVGIEVAGMEDVECGDSGIPVILTGRLRPSDEMDPCGPHKFLHTQASRFTPRIIAALVVAAFLTFVCGLYMRQWVAHMGDAESPL